VVPPTKAEEAELMLHNPDIVANLHTVENLIHRISSHSIVDESQHLTAALSKVEEHLAAVFN